MFPRGCRFARRGIGCLVFACTLGTAGRLGAEPHRVGDVLPSMQLSTELSASVRRMLEESPTFRVQYRRVLDSAKVVIVGRFDPSLTSPTYRARSSIRRYSSGLLIVWMTIAPGIDETKWIAHEFEHVVEQLDGRNLTQLALRRAPGIWYSTGEMIETDRASRAGRVVFDEMRSRRGRSDKFVH